MSSNINTVEFMKKQEIKGIEQVQDLYKSKGIDTKKDIGGIKKIDTITSGNITEKNITDILQNGFNEFKKETGREMTYSEMRAMYG